MRRVLCGFKGIGRRLGIALCACAVALIVGAGGAPAAGQVVTTTDLGTLGGTISQARAVNDNGQIVGTSYTAGNAALHAVLWTQAGGIVDLGTLGGSYGGAVRVSNTGQVVGEASTAGDASVHAFSWTAGGGIAASRPLWPFRARGRRRSARRLRPRVSPAGG